MPESQATYPHMHTWEHLSTASTGRGHDRKTTIRHRCTECPETMAMTLHFEGSRVARITYGDDEAVTGGGEE